LDRDESFASVMAALAANVVIAIAKGTAAALTGSPALLAETLHTTADAGNEIFLWIAIRRSRRPADATHPFGYTVVNGGGGFGDPLRRDPAAVERDLADGLVSPAAAAAVYGVVPGD
jgi:N-methylhydantoinase B/oxoprolinase/acetone carboxylase alpha subunit